MLSETSLYSTQALNHIYPSRIHSDLKPQSRTHTVEKMKKSAELGMSFRVCFVAFGTAVVLSSVLPIIVAIGS